MSTAQGLLQLVEEDRTRALSSEAATVYSLRLSELLPHHPIVAAGTVMKLLGTSRPTAGKALAVLEQVGTLVEMTGKKRDRTYHYARYLNRLREGTDL